MTQRYKVLRASTHYGLMMGIRSLFQGHKGVSLDSFLDVHGVLTENNILIGIVGEYSWKDGLHWVYIDENRPQSLSLRDGVKIGSLNYICKTESTVEGINIVKTYSRF